MLLGDKYGHAPLPLRIQAEEFQILKDVAKTEGIRDAEIFDEWFRLNSNAIPPVYTLQAGKSMIDASDYVDAKFWCVPVACRFL